MEITEEEEGGWPMEEGRALEGLEEGRFFFTSLYLDVVFSHVLVCIRASPCFGRPRTLPSTTQR